MGPAPALVQPLEEAGSRRPSAFPTFPAQQPFNQPSGLSNTAPKQLGQRCRLPRANSVSSSSSDESSSSSSSGSTRTSRKQRMRWDVSERLARPLEAPHAYLPYLGASRRKSFVFVPGLLDERGIHAVHCAQRQPYSREIKDRKDTLNFQHVAYRVETALRAQSPLLYERLLEVMAWADANTWTQLPELKAVYPEFEYIVYDARTGKPGTIEPHVDNYSVVSMVCMLSHPSEFVGGANVFESTGEPGAKPRKIALRRGDAVFFRGEKLTHWITPVTGGVRAILQIELSRV